MLISGVDHSSVDNIHPERRAATLRTVAARFDLFDKTTGARK
jgi:hypothetical protein